MPFLAAGELALRGNASASSECSLGAETPHSRSSLDFGQEPHEHTRESESQELLQEVRERLPKAVLVHDGRPTSHQRLLEDSRRNLEQNLLIR